MELWHETPTAWSWAEIAAVVGIVMAMIAVVIIVFKAGSWKGRVDGHMTAVNAFMNEISADIKIILGRLGPATVETGSPMQLTDLGHSVSADIGASEWARARAKVLAAEVDGMLAYDIQALAFQHAEKFEYGRDMEVRIKQCASDRGLKRQQVLDVLAIELRDQLLSLQGLEPPRDAHRRWYAPRRMHPPSLPHTRTP